MTLELRCVGQWRSVDFSKIVERVRDYGNYTHSICFYHITPGHLAIISTKFDINTLMSKNWKAISNPFTSNILCENADKNRGTFYCPLWRDMRIRSLRWHEGPTITNIEFHPLKMRKTHCQFIVHGM